MRRRRCSVVSCCGFLLALAGHASTGGAQASANEGALFLLAPIGARAVGVGQAVVADQPGTEAIWWNPAGIARADRVEIALHHSENIFAVGDAVTLLLPSSLLGVAALSANILNYGTEPVVDPNQVVTGSVTTRNVVYAGTYATTFGASVNAGLTYKVVQLRIDCSGSCGFPSSSASTSGLDLGAQYAPRDRPYAAGLSLRNVGLRLQVNDREQADPLPTRVQLGVLYRYGPRGKAWQGTELRVSGDILDELNLQHPAARVGLEVTVRRAVHVRGGYAVGAEEAGGLAAGLGVQTENVVIDFARIFDGLSADAGKPPTFLSLRYLF